MDLLRRSRTLSLVALAIAWSPVQFNPAAAVWRVRATNHFEVFYTQQHDFDPIAQEAERAYGQISRDLGRQVSAKVPLSLVPSAHDLPHSEQEAAGMVGASGAPVGRDHLFLSVEPRTGREERLAHELTHIFEFDQRVRCP
jgi:hypothetical protein